MLDGTWREINSSQVLWQYYAARAVRYAERNLLNSYGNIREFEK